MGHTQEMMIHIDKKMKAGFLLSIIIFLTVAACKNLEDAKPADRSTFLHFYGGVGNYQAVAADIAGDGFILVGDSVSSSEFTIIVIQMDGFGNQVWRKGIKGGTAGALKVLSDGYLIVGDSIKVNLKAAQVNDLYIRKSRLIKMDLDGTITNGHDLSYGDTTTVNNKRVDYSADALTTDGNTIFTVNSVRNANKNIKSMVTALKFNTTSSDTLWSETFDLINRDFVNSKSAHLTSQAQVIWANTSTFSTQNAIRAYVELPVVRQSSTFDNSSKFGQNDDLYYSGNDIQPSGAGYGVVGTFQTITGGNKNILFLRVGQDGTVISGSERFFDGVSSADNSTLANKTDSQTDDEGSALTPTSDGGFLLAGSSATSTARGNGGTDIFLIRLDPFGTPLWNEVIGGVGDERVSTVRQTPDGGFLICGTLDLAGLQSMFVLKTNSKGKLQN